MLNFFPPFHVHEVKGMDEEEKRLLYEVHDMLKKLTLMVITLERKVDEL